MRAITSTAGRWAVGMGTAATLLLAGTGTALADETPAPTPPSTHAPITLTPEESAKVCNERIPHILARIDKLTTRANADAGTKGSTAWLKAKAEEARKAGKTARADALQKRVDERPAKVAKLADAQKRATAFKTAHC